ncbi:hypothetical protein BZA77DRAFT_289815 [Pyronema omphalodes]|nr:hypothetical protein BZA77DRAFT_289815 [Pyronema omphalodes]
MKITILTGLSLLSLALAAPSSGGASNSTKPMTSTITGRAVFRQTIGCEWSVGVTKVTGIISCCKKEDLTDCLEQPLNVNCKKEKWLETCCIKENGIVVKDGRGGKCRKEDDGVRLIPW